MRNSRAVIFSGLATSQHKNCGAISCSNDTENPCRVALPSAEASSQLLLFSHWVMFNSFPPHGLHHARLFCHPLSAGGCSNSCPLSWWCYLTTSSSATPFSFCLQSFPASGSFTMSLSPHLFFPQTYLFLTEGKLLHNIALASAIRQHVSATGIHVSPPSLNSLPPPILSHPSRLLQSPGLSSLHHTANSHWLPILYIVGYMLLYSLSICHTLTFLLLTHVHKSVLYVCISTVAV